VKRSPLNPMSPKRRATLAAAGVPNPFSTLAGSVGIQHPPKRHRNAGPAQATVTLLRARSGGVCEFPDCRKAATDKHHRLNRKAGGRRGAMAERINGVAWLLDACRTHHAYVTSPHGEALTWARRFGWVLVEGQDALLVPVLVRHSASAVFLSADGAWSRTRVGAA
jgi:hypothetical protein